MFSATKDPGTSRRRSRVHSHDTIDARSPTLSLVSATTGASSSSSGSMSTLLPDSCTKPKPPKEAKRKSRRPSETDVKLDDAPVEATEGGNDVDVFEFLVAGGKLEAVKPDVALVPSQDITNRDSDKAVQSEDVELEGYYRNQLSDSGISIGGSICDSHADSFIKHPLPTLIEETTTYSAYTPPMADPYYPEPHLWGAYPITAYTPEPTPLSPVSIRSYAYPHDYPYHGTPDPPSTGESSVTCLDSTPLVFRDKSSDRAAPPRLFRNFAKVNSRILLQMQANIADLEHELALLDSRAGSPDRITKPKKGESKNQSKHHGKDQQRRADLYQDLHSSLEQYYSSLLTFHQINQITSLSELEDGRAFKTWLQSHVTPSSKIYPLLGDGTDLVQFSCSSKENPHSPGLSTLPDQALRIIAFIILTNVAFPLLFFKLIGGVISRLLILSLAAIISALVLDRRRTSSKLELNDMHWYCMLGCTTVSFIAALFF